jgi:molybdopterin-guanine dinucleotide biosynthesis protein A
MNLLGAIIAGGRSSRMDGNEKLFIEIGGRNLIARHIERLTPQLDRLVINANGDASRFKSFGLAVIPDLPASPSTPLAGLAAILAHANKEGFDACLTVPSDTPFLPSDLVARLKEVWPRPAIASSSGHDHYLTGLWPTALEDSLTDFIATDSACRVQDFARLAKVAVISWSGAPFDPFFNVNTPADLAEAEKIAREHQP